jgi:hypothetical protein
LVNPVIILQNPDLTAITIESFIAHTLFFTHNVDVFKGIILNTGAAGVLIAGERQIRALQKKIPDFTIDTSITSKYYIRFDDNLLVESLGIMGVGIFFGTIDFAIMPTNTFFLFCFANIKKHDIYLNSTRDVLIYNGKNYFIVIKNEHPWFLLNNLEGIVLHLIKIELRQFYRRFGHPAADRLQRFLTKAGIEDIDRSVLKKINRICHQCQMHSGKSGRFRFTLRKNANFNHRFIVNIMFIEGKPVLYAVDEATAF